MEEAKKHRMKAFAWDQLVRPFYLLFNLHQLKALLLALLLLSVAVFDAFYLFWTCAVVLGIIFIVDVVKYYKSGEFMHNYRKFKYPDYKKAAKAFKREKKSKLLESAQEIRKQEQDSLESSRQHLNSLNNLNAHEKTEEKGQEREG